MLKGLRLRLAVVFTVFTGAVLAVAVAITGTLAVRQTVNDNEQWFSNTVDTVTSVLLNSVMAGEPVNLYTAPYLVSVKRDGVFIVPAAEPAGDTAVAAEAVGTGNVLIGGDDEMSDEARMDLFEGAKSIAEANGLTDWVTESYRFAFETTATLEAQNEATVVEDTGDYTEVQEATGAAAVNEATDVAAADEADEAGAAEDTYALGQVYGVVGPAYSADDAPAAVAISIGPLVGTEGVFEMSREGAHYRATYFQWPMYDEAADRDAVFEVAIAEDLAGQSRTVVLTVLGYLLLFLGGIGLLFLANWWLARLVLRPTEEGIRRQTEFVAAASHELRGPLAVIRSSLSAADSAAGAEEAKRYRAVADSEAERMGRLVNDLLLLAGGDAGSWAFEKAPVDLDTLLIDAGETFRPMAKEKGVGLVLDLPEETLPNVTGDAERLRQIMTILLDNALQYAPKGSEITLGAQQKKNKLVITVADKGPGIPEDEKEKVFVRFYRADASRHDKAHFGLGLSIARELAALHGGTLGVGDTPGGGATFTLALPIL